MTAELTTVVDWFGTAAGVLGVIMAIYLQLINPRRCKPSHVMALFAGGSALVLTFSAAWSPHDGVVATLKVLAILIFVTLEVAAAYYVWKTAEVAPPREVVSALFNDNGGPT